MDPSAKETFAELGEKTKFRAAKPENMIKEFAERGFIDKQYKKR